MEAVRLNLGKGLPIVHLLHETSQGYTQQIVSDGNTQGRQQRTAWLNADATFYRLAKFMGAAGVAILLWLTWTTWLKRRTV